VTQTLNPPAHMLIDGTWLPSVSGRTFSVEDPSVRGRVIAEVARGDGDDVERAVAAAAAAFRTWRKTTWTQRGRALIAIAEQLETSGEELARTLAGETGAAIRTQARPEIALTAEIFRYFGGLTSQLKGETTPLGEGMLSYTRREPWGVVAAIVPWNAPASLSAHKIAPAIAAGNTIVIKPSVEAPLTVLALARICQAHLPKGVVNVVTGSGADVGMPLASHPLVRKITFTGNTDTGKALLHVAADRIVPATLELGGKSPSLVYADSDDMRVVDGVIAAMRFTRQGQSCSAGSRLFLHQDIFGSFMSKLATRLSALKVGDPLDEATDIGSLANKRQFERVCSFLEDGIAQGARAVVGGMPPASGPLAAGYYALPTVLADVTPAWRVAREEVFGPVLVAIPWKDEDEVIRLANDTHYGLAAYIWSRDLGRALRAAHEIEAGWIQINQAGKVQPGHFFGGQKQSGLGREGSFEIMLENYTQRKNVTVNIEP